MYDTYVWFRESWNKNQFREKFKITEEALERPIKLADTNARG